MLQINTVKSDEESFSFIDVIDTKLNRYALKYDADTVTDSVIIAENELINYLSLGNIQKVAGMLKEQETLMLLFSSSIRKSKLKTALRAVWLLTKACHALSHQTMENKSMRSLLESFINETENCRGVTDILNLFEHVMLDLAAMTREIISYKHDDYCPLVKSCIEVILDSMPEKPSLNELSASLHVTPKYLSTLFNQDTGMSITDFMQNIRIDLAKYMLTHSDMKYPDISNYLCFGSQSYFNQVFKKKTGITPREYRQQERFADENSYNYQ